MMKASFSSSSRPQRQPPVNPSSATSTKSLVVHSSPVQLATRSLSARAAVSSTHSSQVTHSEHSLTQRPLTDGSTVVHRKQKQRHASRKKTESSKGKVVEPLDFSVEKGFNLTDHLRESADNDRHGRSASPSVHQLLQDISSIMRAVSPVHQPPSPTLQIQSEQHDGARQRKEQSGSPKLSRKANLRSRVVANFNLETTGEQKRFNGELWCTDDTHRSTDTLSGEQSKHHNSKVKPGIPHLYFESSNQPEAKISLEAAYEVKGSSGDADKQFSNGVQGGSDLGSGHQQTEDKGNRPVEEPTSTASKDTESQHHTILPTNNGSKGEQAKAMRDLLEEKKAELSRSRLEELEKAQEEVEAQERRQLEREQRRAAKLKADRKAAIEELKKKREERRILQERVAQEEVDLVQASGKVKKSKSHVKKSRRKAEISESQIKESADRSKENQKLHNEKLVDEFFEAGSVKPPTSAAISPTPPILHPPASSSSTYQEIMDTLRLLEEVPPALQPPPSPTTNTGSTTLNKEHGSWRGGMAAATTISRGQGDWGGGGAAGKLSDSKLESILSYLDQVERAEGDRSNQLAQSGPTSSLLPPKPSDVTDLEAAAATANDVTATILAQRMELDSKTKTVSMLEKALSQQRELTVYHAKEMEKEGQKRLQLQKAEYETTIQRHQSFIDQLIEDKKVLSERCEQLVRELKDLDKKCKTKLATLQDTHAAEISKLKQVSAAADKLRREKWCSEETQRIKEATVKGLEPEIQRIIAKGKAEVQRLKAMHEAELLQADERASRRFVAQMEEVREQCAVEKEQACAHERELARQRYEKMAEQEELNYQQQRRRLFGEVAQEKEKMADQLRRQKETFDLRHKETLEFHERHVEELRLAHQQQQEELQLRHRAELRNKEEKWEAQRLTWEESLIRNQEAEMMAKERELRTKLREDRDKEIEMVISRLESETASTREETERAAEARVRRIREKYEAEMKEVERSERSTLEKYNSMKSQVGELEGEVALLKSRLRQRDQEVEKIGEVASKLTQERDGVADIVRQEFADRLVNTEEENKQLKIEMSELRARHKVELERERKTKAKELEEVHQRVKQALEKKEENLTALKEQHEAALKRAEHLQMLLQRQRTQLLKK